MRKETTLESSVKNQYLAATAVNLLILCYGISIGWSSPNLLILESDESPIGKITKEEASWVASIQCFGGFISNIFFGFITTRFGRKIPLILMAVPTIIAWSLILFAQNVYYLYAARFLNGAVGGVVYTIIPLYLSEIAIDRVRGFLGSTLVLTGNVGILIEFIFGNYCDFYMASKFVITVAIVYAISILLLPETPTFLVKQNQISKAKKSIKFYRNLSGKPGENELVEMEIVKLKNAVTDVKSEQSDDSSLKWSDITTGAGGKAMAIGVVLAALNQLSGVFAMLQYTASIFQDAGSNMSPNMSAIVVAVIQLFGSYVSTVLVDRAGRKVLFAISSIGISLGLIVLGIYTMLQSAGYNVETFNFIPIASFSFVMFIASWAVLTLPFLVISEIMPEKIKDFASTVCNGLVWVGAFIVIKYLPLMTELLAFHWIMFAFATVGLLCAAFIILYMPETKGRSYTEIMISLE